MALEKFNLNLAGVDATAASSFSGTSSDVSVTGGNATVTAVTKSVGSAKLEGFGTLYANAASDVKFVADANMKSGAYSASMNGSASISTFDASKASAKLSLTTSLVSVDSGVLKGGFGDDNILVDDNAATDLQIFGGKGADTFELKSSDAKVTVVDYNYIEGDKISVSSAPTIGAMTNGTLTVGGTTVTGYVADNVYKFGVIADKKYDYVAGVTNADVNYTAGTDNLVFNADGNGSVIIDASKAASTSINATVANANITLGGTKNTENHVSVGGTDKTAVVDLSYGKDSIEALAGTALTLKVGKEDGVENSLKSALDSDDTLVLTDGKISDIVIDTNSAGVFNFGATTIKNVFSANANGAFKVKFGSDEAQKLAYGNNTGAAIEYSKDSYYLGGKSASISVAATTTDDIVLDMAKFTSGITSVDVSAVTTKAAVDITAKADTSITASADHADAEWKFNLTANENTKVGYLDLGVGKKGVDSIVLSDAKGNQDSVKGFTAGEDILVLSDVDKLTEKTFSLGTTAGAVVLQNSKASIDGAFKANTDLDVVLSDGTAKKVALTDGSSSVATATQKTTTVINQTAAAAKVEFNIAEATENNAAFVVDMTGTVNNAIDYLGKFSSIAATVAAADALIIGNDATTSIGVNGSADHGAAVWAGAKANATIEFDNVTTNAGNILWTGALDGASTVKNFDDKDKLYVYGVDGLSKTAVAEGFEIDGNNVVYKTGDASMTFNVGGNNKTGNINVMYMDSTAKGGFGYQKVAYTNAAANAVNFTTDVDVYIGTGDATVSVANDAVAEGQITAINLSNKGAGSVEDGGAYYKGIHNIDASKSAGTFLLIGDNTDGAELIGGVNGNAIWGGGNAGQTMTGSNGAFDIFWFGSNDGYDDVANFSTKEGDAVFLYDATSIDAVQITAEGADAKVVFRDTSCTLTLNNVSNIDDVKFMLNNADGGYDYYKYDSKTSAFVQQKA